MKNPQQPFSLRTYLLIVVAISWPFQIAYVLWAETPFMRYALSSLPMIMVTVATYIPGRYIFRDGFSQAGWNWGKSKHYLVVFSIAIASLNFIRAEAIIGNRMLAISGRY